MRSISQLTKNFYNAYYNTYPNYYFYIKGFAFGKSTDRGSDYYTNYQGINVRYGNSPTWADVNQTSYKNNYYVGTNLNIESMILNYLKAQTVTSAQSPMNNAIFNFILPYQLKQTDGITDLNFEFDEIYVYFALYDINNPSNEQVFMGYYINALNNIDHITDGQFITYSPYSLVKYIFNVELTLTDIYHRMEMKDCEFLVLNAPEDNTTHRFISFLNSTPYTKGWINLTNGMTTKTLRIVKKVITYIDETHNTTIGYIIEGVQSDLDAIQVGWENISDNNPITYINKRITYLPIETVHNNEDPNKTLLLSDMDLTDAQILYYKTFEFQLYADMYKIKLEELMLDSLYYDKPWYDIKNHVTQDEKDLAQMNIIDNYTKDELCGFLQTYNITNPYLLKTLELYREVRHGDNSNPKQYGAGTVYYNLYKLDLTSFQTTNLDFDTFEHGIDNIKIQGFELEFDFTEINYKFEPFYFYVMDLSNNILAKYLINDLTFKIQYDKIFQYAYSIADNNLSFNTMTIKKLLLYF